MVKIKISILFFIFHLFFIPAYLEAWNETRTHPDLSEIAAKKSILGNRNYLMNIGFSKGINENINGKEIFKWLRDGAELEDKSSALFPISGTTRSLNHFHNPLKGWSQSGLDDWYINHYTGESSLLWAQDGNKQQSVIEGDWSWQKTRQYYYLGLTSSTETTRQENFARTFRGLGHQLHLLQDTAVPDHVRNDAHPEDALFGKDRLVNSFYFETWTKMQFIFINTLASNPVAPKVVFDVSPSKDAPVPITYLYDSDQYTGANPSNSLTQGLAEYTNANFFSKDTLFAAERYQPNDRHYFPYPKKSSTDLASFIAGTKAPENIMDDDGSIETVVWISKIKDGENIAHFVRPGFLTNAVYRLFGEGASYYRTFYRDEKCHEDYVSYLIPRAVGYSAGLLNYFFRGDINLKYESETNPGYVITNNSDENMNGTFQIFYDKKDDNRTELWRGTLSINAHGTSGRIDFQEPDPEDAKEPGRYILVFRGTLGNEKDAVAGRVAGRLLEITPPSQYVYSIIDGSIDPQQFKKIKAKIRNATGEEIKNGTLQAVAKYIKRTDYEPDLSADPPTTESREPDFSYSVSEQIPIPALSATEPAEFTFDFSNSPIPAGITDLYLQVIFKGTIGDETDTASAIGTKDLAEPTHHVFWNLSDMFSLNGQLYTAEDIKNDSALASLVDFDHDGIFNETSIQEPYIDPVDTDLKIAYFGENPPAGPVTNVATVDKLPAGRHIRLVMLLDRLTNNYLRLTWSDDIYPESHYDFVFSGAINQDVQQEVNGQEDIVFNYTPPTSFRVSLDSDGVASIPIRQHFSQGILSCLPRSSPRGCFYPDEEAMPANPEPVPVNILFP